jgi:hypothetical protein
MKSEIFNENFVTVDPNVIEEWLPLIEGTGDWADFVSACPVLNGQHEIEMMAQVLENTHRMLEASTSSDAASGTFKPIIMALTRRVAADVIGNKIFGLQPMKSSSAMAFALRGVFTGTSESTKTVTYDNSVILTLSAIGDLVEGQNLAATADDTGEAPEETATGLVIHVDGNNILVKVLSGTFGVDDDLAFNALVVAQDAGEATVSASYSNEAALGYLLPNYSGPMSTATGEAMGTTMNEIGLNVESGTVTAQSHKLKTKWTQELAEDLKAEQGVSAEAVLGGIAKDQLIREMNRRFIDLVNTNSGTTATWDYSAADGRYEGEKFVNFKSKAARVRDSITIKNHIGPATFAICGSRILNMIEAIGLVPSDTKSKYSSSYRGNAMGMDIYADIWGNENVMLFGRKGANQADAGIIYCPYVPIKMDKGMGEETGQPVAFFRTRYGLLSNIFGTSNFYAKLTTSSMPA